MGRRTPRRTPWAASVNTPCRFGLRVPPRSPDPKVAQGDVFLSTAGR
jgi:hypothetical protein